MPRQRRRFSGPEKVAMLRKNLIDTVPISTVCDRLLVLSRPEL